MKCLLTAAAIIGAVISPASGFVSPSSSSSSSSCQSSRPSSPSPSRSSHTLQMIQQENGNNKLNNDHKDNNIVSRQSFLSKLTATTTTAATTALILASQPAPSLALVKGNAPPPKKSKSSAEDETSSSSDTKKCRNVEECQEMAERAEMLRQQKEAERAANGPKAKLAPGGTKYLDIEMDSDSNSVNSVNSINDADKITAKAGDQVEIHYKVLKLGKRSYDGLSGEGTVIFSRGYALEDDEKVQGDHSFIFTIGDSSVIAALNDAIPGMTVYSKSNSVRRISVTPQNGWEKSTRECDGGPGGSGTGGELRTDYVVVPTATMVDQEACFDKKKKPFPETYAQERRMAQRFDQSLIVEVKLVNIL